MPSRVLQVRPDLNFDGRCEEALTLYGDVLGAKVLYLLRFEDRPQRPGDEPVPEAQRQKVFHLTFRIGDLELHAVDDRCGGKPCFRGIAFVVKLPTLAEARRAFDGLVEGGQVVLPLTKTFWSPGFGVVTDRFGLTWKVQVVEPSA